MRACGLIRTNTVVYPASSQKEQLLANRCLNFGQTWTFRQISHIMRKPTMQFLTRSNTNRTVQAQKMEILDLESRGIALSV